MICTTKRTIQMELEMDRKLLEALLKKIPLLEEKALYWERLYRIIEEIDEVKEEITETGQYIVVSLKKEDPEKEKELELIWKKYGGMEVLHTIRTEIKRKKIQEANHVRC